MAGPKHKRWIRIAGVAVAVLILAGATAMHFAARSVKDSIQEALGPDGEAAEIKVGLTSIEILDVRIRAPRGWPSDSTLRARRIVVVPDLRELLSDRVRITRIDVEGGYLSALRPKEGGGLRVLPSIAERAKKSEGAAEERRGAVVSTVQITDCVVEVYDATVGGKPQKLRVDAVKGTVEDIRLPELTNRTRIALEGTSKGVSAPAWCPFGAGSRSRTRMRSCVRRFATSISRSSSPTSSPSSNPGSTAARSTST